MNYEMMIPPFERVDFILMNEKQVQEYFDWYISQINCRIVLLSNVVKDEGKSIRFDYTVESLTQIWEWYENKISYREIDDFEYQDKLNKYPNWMKDYISKEEISFPTLMLCMDLAMYFAEVIIRNNPGKVKWSYFTKPKNRESVNEPILVGFKHDIDMNPREVLVNCTRRSKREKLSTRLYDIYNVWAELL